MSEPDVTNLLSVNEAIAILDEAPVELRKRRVKLKEAMGFYLAQDVLADRDYPPFDRSLMDGYAIGRGDLAKGLKDFLLRGEVRAGQAIAEELKPGEAIAIMTGAPLPPGADAVVPIEFTSRNENQIQILKQGDFSRFIARRGTECAAGEGILNIGCKLEAAQLAAAATVGAHEIEIFDPPRVAILATGDELVDLNQQPANHQIRNSNSLMLEALLTRYGCRVDDLGKVNDEMPAIVDAIKKGLKYDAIFITGGMSVGAYDLPPKALEQIGAKFEITKLKIKPGKPFLYARVDSCHVFGLPGNPLAGFVCTIRLASRVLRRMVGQAPFERWINATLAGDLPANGPREFYQPAIFDNGVAQPLGWKGSADVFSLARANSLLVRPENSPAQGVGAECKLIAIPG
ncbi:MAG TPA: molybdopterin molybdotransferase MoeA [Tepidisphaeraceae bacterium]|jgi:molybdopterin molybdotransferase|nr:molybdopterin molybdotransferase MoeA [Tepidisphaeraceae bacterium]